MEPSWHVGLYYETHVVILDMKKIKSINVQNRLI
jgi:hypothetical protein